MYVIQGVNQDKLGGIGQLWHTVDRDVLRNKGLSMEARLVYCYLVGLYNKVDYPISESLGLHPTAVERAQQELIGSDLIRIDEETDTLYVGCSDLPASEVI